MPTEPRQVPVSPQPDAAGRRLHIHGIKEMPAGYDAEVAELFRDLRAATTLTETDLASEARHPARGGAGARAGRALCAAALGRDLPRGERLWRAAQSRRASAAPPHLCAARSGDRRAPAEGDARHAGDDAAGERRFRLRLRQFQRGGAAKSTRYSLAAAGHAATPAASASAASALAECGRPASRRAASAAAECRPSASPAKCLAPGAPGQPHPQGWPAAQPQPQAPRPQQRPRPASAAADRCRPPPRRSRSRRPNRRRRGQRRNRQPQFQPPPQPEPMPVDADFGVPEPRPPEPEPKPKRRRPALLKWASRRPRRSRWWHSACGSRSAMRPAPRGCNLRAAARPTPTIRAAARPTGCLMPLSLRRRPNDH